jgi:hypothetical protein
MIMVIFHRFPQAEILHEIGPPIALLADYKPVQLVEQ